MNKKIVMLGTSIIVLSGFILFSDKALAYKGDPSVQGPNYSEERHNDMIRAFDNNDYNAWRNLMQGKGNVTQIINEQNFARFTEAHRLALEGKTEEAQAIREELGLNLQNSSRQGIGKGYNRNMNR